MLKIFRFHVLRRFKTKLKMIFFWCHISTCFSNWFCLFILLWLLIYAQNFRLAAAGKNITQKKITLKIFIVFNRLAEILKVEYMLLFWKLCTLLRIWYQFLSQSKLWYIRIISQNLLYLATFIVYLQFYPNCCFFHSVTILSYLYY